MALHCGIIGIANSGKTTLFNCMSTNKAEVTSFAFGSSKSNVSIVSVPDPRLFELEKFQPTEKIIPTTVEIIDIPGLVKGAIKGDNVGAKALGDIRNADALIHVIRCFDDENLPHVDGSVDPVRDKETIDLELQIKDLESVEKKIIRLEKAAKVGDKDAKKGIEILKLYKAHLEDFQSARTLDLSDEEKTVVADIHLLSMKPMLYVCNVDENSAIDGNKHSKALIEAVKDENAEVITVAGAMEADIAELETKEEQIEFLQDAGLTEPSVDILIRAAYKLLNLSSFFTIGPKEIRAWTIKKGMSAPQAAGVIHSDLERGFIRAEVMKYNDFIELGSESKVKDAGKFKIEGKTYIVEDGDLLNIRFNV